MATDPGFLDYVLDQLAMGRELVHKRLFGEYGLWLDERIVALVCDDQFLVKPTPAGLAEAEALRVAEMLGGAPPEVPPYPGAKGWLLVEDLDDGEALRRLLRETAAALPAPKARKR